MRVHLLTQLRLFKFYTSCLIKVLFVIFLIQNTSCQNKESATVKNMPQNSVDTKLLQGVWWSADNPVSALFTISGDSLYYTDNVNSPYLIRLSNDTLFMEQGSFSHNVTVTKLTGDSLVYYDGTINEKVELTHR